MNLKTKTAIVTGASSGIGLSVATALAHEGARVVLASRHLARNEDIASDLNRRFGAKTLALEIDVSKEADCEALIAKTVATFGSVEILVNNAGIGGGSRIGSTTTEEFERVLKTNLYGTFWCSRAAFNQMRSNRGSPRGHIINISSLAGKQAWSGTGTYSASKFGVMALTQALAEEGKELDIKSCAICPGMVATPMTGVSGEEYIQPEDIAETVTYLLRLSPAVWMTEIVLPRKGATE